MLLFRDPRTGNILKKEDQIDGEILLRRMECGNWKDVINELFDSPMENANIYNLKLMTALAHWGLEEYEKGRSGGRSGGNSLRAWNM
jgi:hypothetical protein